MFMSHDYRDSACNALDTRRYQPIGCRGFGSRRLLLGRVAKNIIAGSYGAERGGRLAEAVATCLAKKRSFKHYWLARVKQPKDIIISTAKIMYVKLKMK
ncbi:hypothetical protein ElyMa_000717800 [Elysia marginata]|uniref:Uncharacterized protein n=1 Tax=Elysia marginata TaxID=1093978 RepID=A0AAV4GNU8_9GAST|nr:hypothetical protein ElyMa_000717800 [Elysia marginata]